MNNLTKDDLISIHKRIQERFQTTAGISEPGLVSSIVQKPNQILYGKETFPDAYLKAASLMEATIRWHAFADGNKRTGLLATEQYLKVNGYFCLYPVHAVRFSVIIANTQGTDPNTTDRLILKIAEWLKNYVCLKSNTDRARQIAHKMAEELKPIREMLEKDSNSVEARKILDHWLAIDIYPEYRKDMIHVLDFLTEMYEEILNHSNDQTND